MLDVGLWPLGPEDLPDLRRLALAQGRNVHPDEFDRFLQLEGAGGLVMRTQDSLVGAITTMRHFEHGFLGPLFATERLSTSLALALYGQAVERLGGVKRVEVEATDEEARLLRGMGFETVRETRVLERAPAQAEGDGAARALEPRDWLDVGALDGAAVGYGRKGFLAALHEADPSSALVVERGGDIDGYAFLRRSRRGYHLGPLVTQPGAQEVAQALVRAAVARVANWPVVALAHDDARGFLEREGFAEVGRLHRLRAGRAPDEGDAREWVVGSRLTG